VRKSMYAGFPGASYDLRCEHGDTEGREIRLDPPSCSIVNVFLCHNVVYVAFGTSAVRTPTPQLTCK